jgi:hypothetical protein
VRVVVRGKKKEAGACCMCAYAQGTLCAPWPPSAQLQPHRANCLPLPSSVVRLNSFDLAM